MQKPLPTLAPRIDLIDLWRYRVARQRAEAARSSYDTARKSTNVVLDKLMRDPKVRDLVSKLWRLEAEISVLPGQLDVVAREGQDHRLLDAENFEEGASARATILAAAKSIARELLPAVHPDRGGDPLLFQAVRDAQRRGDLAELGRLRVTVLQTHNLYWQQTNGIDFWEEQLHLYTARLSKLRSNVLSLVVRPYVSGNKPESIRRLRVYLDVKIQEREQERLYLISNWRTRNGKERNGEGQSEDQSNDQGNSRQEVRQGN